MAISPAQHVHQVRQLVEREAAQQPPGARDPRVALHDVDPAPMASAPAPSCAASRARTARRRGPRGAGGRRPARGSRAVIASAASASSGAASSEQRGGQRRDQGDGSRRITVTAAHADPLPTPVLHHPRGRGRHALVRVRAPLRGRRAPGADGNRGIRRHARSTASRWWACAAATPTTCAPPPPVPARMVAFARFALAAPRCRAARAAAGRGLRHLAAAHDRAPGAARGRPPPRAARVRGARPLARGADPDGRAAQPAARRLARVLERRAYRAPQRVIALSPGIRAGVGAAGVPAERISWSRTHPTSSCSPRPRPRRRARAAGLRDGFSAATSAPWARRTT